MRQVRTLNETVKHNPIANHSVKITAPDFHVDYTDLQNNLAASIYDTRTAQVQATPVFTYQQIASQLTDGYWNDNGASHRSFIVGTDKAITVNLSGLNATYKAMATTALTTWSDITGVKFKAINGAAEIRFQQTGSLQAYSSSGTSGETITSSMVNVSTDWLTYCGKEYTLQTFIHEIGHALGLGHAGNYNGSAQYGVDNLFANDSWQTTIMSYFSQDQNTSADASFAYLLTPMLGDILAIESLYGNGTTTRTSNTVYGYNSTAGTAFNFAGMKAPSALAIVDDGGTDTLDNSKSAFDTRVDLNPGTISDMLGLRGNVAIDFTTSIENYVGGTGVDTVTGNNLANSIKGGAGNDILSGGAGNDSLDGGADIDQLDGGDGDDIFVVDRTEDVVRETNSDLVSGGSDQVNYGAKTGVYALTDNVEKLLLTGTGASGGIGNGLSNTMTGNSGANALSGEGGDDIIKGMAGNDTIRGGGGNDNLYGGTGADKFVFDTALDATGNVDRIFDYRVADDTIQLDHTVFSALAGLGLLSLDQFIANLTGLAQDASDHIIYERDTGNLYYDADGTGSTEAIQFAALSNNLSMVSTEFFII